MLKGEIPEFKKKIEKKSSEPNSNCEVRSTVFYDKTDVDIVM